MQKSVTPHIKPKPIEKFFESDGLWLHIFRHIYTHIWLFIGMKEPLLTFTCSAKPNLIITRDKETISVEAKSTLKTDKIKFKLNEEFDEKTPDSRQVQSKFFLRNVTENGKVYKYAVKLWVELMFSSSCTSL
uniref:Lipocalin/cytosolic fatty-acid binding domain-containing protein n=1 Tax=Poecilia reticulata TaxID=8081 RepID=A0A3P9Q250_POERE